jgi:hypothetical protein
MSQGSSSLADPFFSLYFVLQVHFRRIAQFRQSSMNPVEPSSSNGQIDGMGGNQYNDAQQKLFEGVERGYNNVLHKLSQIENRLQILPKMTAETLSAQLQRRTDVKAVNEHQQDVCYLTVDYDHSLLKVRRKH